MKPFLLLLTGLAVCTWLPAYAATPLTESIFTEIIREANVITATKTVAPAQTNEVFKAPDRVRTGPASRVELTAPDHTITRVGANTVFTFEPGERNILLEKGTVLFNSPAGAGGGTVRYHGTAAAVLGTTMVCAVLPDGSFKVLDLEGHVKVTLKNNLSFVLEAGQMIIVPPDGDQLGEVKSFNLAELSGRLLLVVGFSSPLPSLPLITAAIQEQNKVIAAGDLPDVASFPAASFGLGIITPVSNQPPWLLNAPDHAQVYVSPVR
jgi:hypothetical protein